MINGQPLANVPEVLPIQYLQSTSSQGIQTPPAKGWKKLINYVYWAVR
jgi:hypothetical protein